MVKTGRQPGFTLEASQKQRGVRGRGWSKQLEGYNFVLGVKRAEDDTHRTAPNHSLNGVIAYGLTDKFVLIHIDPVERALTQPWQNAL